MSEQKNGLKFKTAKQRRVHRKSTKSRRVVRARNLKPLIAILSAAAVVIVAAVVWGTVLGERADEYESMKAEGQWTLPPSDSSNSPSAISETLSAPLSPSQTVWDLTSYGDESCSGATLTVYAEGKTHYYSDVGLAAGLGDKDMYSLPKKVEHLHSESKRVTCIFHVASLTPAEDGSAALSAYLRGTELALIEEFAQSGADEILLVGCPVSLDATDGKTTRTMDFLRELNTRLTTSLGDKVPAVGVALPIEIINAIYTGDTSAAQILSQCDFLTMDMQNPDEYPLFGGSDLDYDPQETEEEATEDSSPISDMLKRFSYVYRQYPMRLMFNEDQRSEITKAISHGFLNISVVE